MRVLVFGASITYGQGGVAGSWVEKIRATYDTQPKKDVTIMNLGVSGNTAQDVLDRFKNETEARDNRSEGGELAFVFSVGANDLKVLQNGREITSIEEYRHNIDGLIRQAKEYSKRILFVELTPCVSDRITDAVFSNDRISEFNKTIREVCFEHSVAVAPIFDDFSKFLESNDCLPDGLHPNNEGYEFMASTIKPLFDEAIVR